MDDRRQTLVSVVAVIGAVALTGVMAPPDVAAGPPAATASIGSRDVMIAIPAHPDAELLVLDRADSAEAAFQKLDAEGKGYIAHADVNLMPEFDDAFRAHDADRDGNLTQREFRNAWQSYTSPR